MSASRGASVMSRTSGSVPPGPVGPREGWWERRGPRAAGGRAARRRPAGRSSRRGRQGRGRQQSWTPGGRQRSRPLTPDRCASVPNRSRRRERGPPRHAAPRWAPHDRLRAAAQAWSVPVPVSRRSGRGSWERPVPPWRVARSGPVRGRPRAKTRRGRTPRRGPHSGPRSARDRPRDRERERRAGSVPSWRAARSASTGARPRARTRRGRARRRDPHRRLRSTRGRDRARPRGCDRGRGHDQNRNEKRRAGSALSRRAAQWAPTWARRQARGRPPRPVS